MKNYLQQFFEKQLFNNFFSIDLTTTEKTTANESLSDKYVKGLAESFILGIIALPAILFLDVTLLVSVLIPITMVSGTAWFAVSLVNIKKKFENFGNELTKDLYRSFCTSLVLLSLIAVVSLNKFILDSVISFGGNNNIISSIAGILGTYVVLKMIYDVFAGATKYDMNDSMLTGQNESADKYFKRSLSLLNACADNLKVSNPKTGTSAYYLGLAFFEIFNYIKITRGTGSDIEEILNKMETLKTNLPKDLANMRNVSIELVEKMIGFVINIQDKNTKKSLNNIQLELGAIRNNTSEDLDLLNLRLATILEEAEDMLVSQGEELFTKRVEIERKYLVSKLPDLATYEYADIEQGYTSITSTEEERVRRRNNEYYHTIKKTFDTGYREEIEKRISETAFQELWEKTENKRIKKRRYMIPIDNKLTIELDVFDDGNKGLILAEIEFHSEEDVNKFLKPGWLGEDVTVNPEYKNANLAK